MCLNRMLLLVALVIAVAAVSLLYALSGIILEFVDAAVIFAVVGFVFVLGLLAALKLISGFD